MEFIFYEEPLMDLPEAKLETLAILADGGDLFAQRLLGDLYEYGDASKRAWACQWYLNAAQHGCRFSQYKIGTMYLNGWGLKQNNKKALLWFMKARHEYVEEGCLPECFNHVYLDNVRVRPKSDDNDDKLRCAISMMTEKGLEIKEEYSLGGASYCSAGIYYNIIKHVAL